MSLIHNVKDLFQNRNGEVSKHHSWAEIELTEIVKIQNGYAFASTDFNVDKVGIQLIRIRDILNDASDTYFKGVYSEEYVVKNGDLLIGMDGDFNSSLWKGEDGVLNQRVCRLIPNENRILKKFLAYGIGGYLKVINENTSSTTVKHLSSKSIGEIPFPLPPLPEQHRIVAKLDALFASLESTKARLAKIPQLMKNFRQAVLTQAVTGKLTEEWREGKELEEWDEKSIEEISDSLSGFAFKSDEFVDSGIQLIRMGNLYNNKLDLTRNPVYLPEEFNREIVKKYSLKENDVLLSLTGTKYKRDYGFAIKVDSNKPLLLNQRIVALRPKINVDYFLYLLRDDIFRNQFFSFETGGVNQGNVGVRSVLSIIVPVPPLEEQHEIVRRVERLFAKADAIEQQYQTLKQKIEALPQAILGKAFRGELVEQ